MCHHGCMYVGLNYLQGHHHYSSSTNESYDSVASSYSFPPIFVFSFWTRLSSYTLYCFLLHNQVHDLHIPKKKMKK